MRVDERERLEQRHVAALHEEHTALDRAVLGGEIGDERRHVARVARVELALFRLRTVLDARDRLDEARHRRGCDGVDAHAVAVELHLGDDRQRRDARFRRAVVGLADVAEQPDVDDVLITDAFSGVPAFA